MIDLDQMEAQLAAAARDGRASRRAAARPAPASTPRPARKPAPAPQLEPSPRARRRATHPEAVATVGELLEHGRLVEMDDRIAATDDARDRLTWATMRALLEGRGDAAAAGVRRLGDLGAATGDAEAAARAWEQRFWVAFEWGTDTERYDVLDHCRERAYRYDDLGWWGNLTLLLAAMGKADEATRAFDAALALVAGGTSDSALDVVTNLIDAAATLGDAGRVIAAGRYFRPAGRLVVVGDGVVCKGSADRYQALVHAARGHAAKAAECFRHAEADHEAIGAGPLVARTRRQATGTPAAA